MKAKTYQIAKNNLKALVDSECSETAVVENDACLFGSLLADTSQCRYVMFDAPYIHRIHKPVYISTDKLGEWLTEWGYRYEEHGYRFLIEFKGTVKRSGIPIQEYLY